MRADLKDSRKFIGNWQLALISTVFSLIIFCLVAELTLRIIEPKSPPGTTYGERVYLNADGLRDRSYIIPKPDSTYRIFVLGDSFTWGIGLPIAETVPKLLEKKLHIKFPNLNVEVINGAGSGYNSVQQKIRLKNIGLKYEPVMVLLLYNLNDIEFMPELAKDTYNEAEVVPIVEVDSGEDVLQFSTGEGIRGFVHEIEYRSALARYMVPRVGAILRQFGLLESPEFSWVAQTFKGFTTTNPGWIESKKALAEMVDLGKEYQYEFVVGIYPLLNELDDYQGKHAHDVIQAFCIAKEITCVDL